MINNLQCKHNCEREYELRRKVENDLEMCERTKKEMELKMELMNKERNKESNTMQEYAWKKFLP